MTELYQAQTDVATVHEVAEHTLSLPGYDTYEQHEKHRLLSRLALDSLIETPEWRRQWGEL